MRPQSKFLLQIYTIKANHGRRTERSTLIMEEHLRILEFCLVQLEIFFAGSWNPLIYVRLGIFLRNNLSIPTY